MSERSMRRAVERHFAGTIRPAEERAMREHMPGCAACRDHYERHLVLSRLDPTALPRDERIARGLGWNPFRRNAMAALVAMPLGSVVVLAALLSALHPEDARGFSSRGAVLIHDASSSVLVYDAVGRDDELAFSYENGSGKQRLMIFGVDEHRRVYWFYPA